MSILSTNLVGGNMTDQQLINTIRALADREKLKAIDIKYRRDKDGSGSRIDIQVKRMKP